MDVRFKHPFTCILCGPSFCGKTDWVFRFINNIAEIMEPIPEKIIYCYGEYQEIFDSYPQVEFQEGVPNNEIFDGKQRTLVIIDDLLSESGDGVEKLFTKGAHHRDLSVFFLSQNLFYNSKQNRTMNLNTQYLCLFRNNRDASQIMTLARQMYPHRSKFLIEAFYDATQFPYGYLLLDLRSNTPDVLRVRTNIFPGEMQYVYIPK